MLKNGITIARLTKKSKNIFPINESETKVSRKKVSRSSKEDAFWVHPINGDPCVINPHCPYMRRWDMIVLFLLIYLAILTPYETAFLEPSFGTLFFINRIVDAVFIKDLIMRFFLMYFDSNRKIWVSSRKEIREKYLRGWFIIDAVSVLPFDSINLVVDSSVAANLGYARSLKLFRLIKLFRIVKGASIFRRWESKLSISYGYMSLLKFLIAVVAVSHWVACILRAVVELEQFHLEDGTPFNWMTEHKVAFEAVSEAHHFRQYIIAFYWSVMTLTTIGYGDVLLQTYGEKSVATVCMLLGGGVYAYVVGGVCQIVNSMDAATNHFHQTMDTLNDYVVQNGIPDHLKERLRDYFHSSRSMHQEKLYHELLIGMSPGLRGEVSKHNHQWIDRIHFFQCGFPLEQSDFLTELAMVLKPACFGPNEQIIRLGEYNTKMYLIQRGLASKAGRIYGGGSFFGEDIILFQCRRYFHVRALSYLHVQVLEKVDLDAMLHSGQYPEMRRSIRRQKMKVAFQRNFVKYARVYSGRYNSDRQGSAVANHRYSTDSGHITDGHGNLIPSSTLLQMSRTSVDASYARSHNRRESSSLQEETRDEFRNLELLIRTASIENQSYLHNQLQIVQEEFGDKLENLQKHIDELESELLVSRETRHTTKTTLPVVSKEKTCAPAKRKLTHGGSTMPFFDEKEAKERLRSRMAHEMAAVAMNPPKR